MSQITPNLSLFAISLVNYCTVSKIGIQIYIYVPLNPASDPELPITGRGPVSAHRESVWSKNKGWGRLSPRLLPGLSPRFPSVITLKANSEWCEGAKIVCITNIKIVMNLFLVIKTAITDTQILIFSIKSYSRYLLLRFIDVFLLKFYLLQILANQTREPHCGRTLNLQPTIGQANGPHRIIKLLETSSPSKLESDRPRMYQVMTAPNHIRQGRLTWYNVYVQ